MTIEGLQISQTHSFAKFVEYMPQEIFWFDENCFLSPTQLLRTLTVSVHWSIHMCVYCLGTGKVLMDTFLILEVLMDFHQKTEKKKIKLKFLVTQIFKSFVNAARPNLFWIWCFFFLWIHCTVVKLSRSLTYTYEIIEFINLPNYKDFCRHFSGPIPQSFNTINLWAYIFIRSNWGMNLGPFINWSGKTI